MRITKEPITHAGVIAAATTWWNLSRDFNPRARMFRYKARPVAVMRHSGYFAGRWRVIRVASRSVSVDCFEREKRRAFRGALALVWMPFRTFDELSLSTLDLEIECKELFIMQRKLIP